MSQAKKAANQWNVGDLVLNNYKGRTNIIWRIEKIEKRGHEDNYSPLLYIKQVMDIYNPEKKVWATSILDAVYISKADLARILNDSEHALDILKQKLNSIQGI